MSPTLITEALQVFLFEPINEKTKFEIFELVEGILVEHGLYFDGCLSVEGTEAVCVKVEINERHYECELPGDFMEIYPSEAQI